MFRKQLVPCLLLLSLVFSDCQRIRKLPEQVDAHYLRYDIEYLEEQAGDIPTRILPGNMDAYYTPYFVFTRIEGFFNQFSLIQIADLKHREVTTLLNFFGNKVYHTGESGELPAGIARPKGLKCRMTGDTLRIGGLNSERVEVVTENGGYDIYCTREFTIRRPNISTPYHSVEYPLTDFRIQLSMLKMHLSCTASEYVTIESEIFSIPDDYKAVDRATMEHIINSLFTKE